MPDFFEIDQYFFDILNIHPSRDIRLIKEDEIDLQYQRLINHATYYSSEFEEIKSAYQAFKFYFDMYSGKFHQLSDIKDPNVKTMFGIKLVFMLAKNPDNEKIAELIAKQNSESLLALQNIFNTHLEQAIVHASKSSTFNSFVIELAKLNNIQQTSIFNSYVKIPMISQNSNEISSLYQLYVSGENQSIQETSTENAKFKSFEDAFSKIRQMVTNQIQKQAVHEQFVQNAGNNKLFKKPIKVQDKPDKSQALEKNTPKKP